MTDFHPSESDDNVFPELFTPEVRMAREIAQRTAHDRELQTLRNLGGISRDAAEEIQRLQSKLDAQFDALELAVEFEVEYSKTWCSDHPEMFGHMFMQQLREHPADAWRVTLRQTAGFFWLGFVPYRTAPDAALAGPAGA